MARLNKLKWLRQLPRRIFYHSGLIGIVSLIWFLLRTGAKPSRFSYPCQQIARTNLMVFTLPALVIFRQKLSRYYLQHRRLIILLSLALLAGGSAIVVGNQSRASVRLVRPISGQPDSRVVWVQNSAATEGKSYGSNYSNRADQTVVEQMMEQAILTLTNENTLQAAWSKIFADRNEKNGLGRLDYRPGQIIAVKLNFNNAGYANQLNPVPETVLALIRQLVEIKGVSQADIILYDASRSFPEAFSALISARYPNVVLNPNDGFTDESPMGSSGSRLTGTLERADYLINLPLMRTHSLGGVTLSFKNHFGSVASPDSLHSFIMNLNQNALITINSHPWIKNKTVLIVNDALFAITSGGPYAPPNRTTNSLFVSADPVAVDSVIMDFLQSLGANFNGLNPRSVYQQAAASGLGIFENSCSDDSCDFAYGAIDLVKCDPECSELSPTPTPTPNSCPADVNNSGAVNLADLIRVSSRWGAFCSSCLEDINHDNKVNTTDLVTVLSAWGNCH